jgi:hypothetical protein
MALNPRSPRDPLAGGRSDWRPGGFHWGWLAALAVLLVLGLLFFSRTNTATQSVTGTPGVPNAPVTTPAPGPVTNPR